ncbi:hypothetical protein F0562_014375 [Nyssa sinensis]|uniref:Uncharacterized protein n=1 Tax=Nyssa sinensis TaxID=561372 RepID=A0A5J4ZQ57_9ASTE|nr:hypothetical protein F0562_014375 [Nyssa sinensis]
MAALQASSMLCSSVSSSVCCPREIIKATINMPKLRTTSLSLPKLPTRVVEELDFRSSGYIATQIDKHSNSPININFPTRNDTNVADPIVMAKLYTIMEADADRVEMHKNIGEQLNNWNSLLLTSVNPITLAAATMAGIAPTTASMGAPLVALKLSYNLLTTKRCKALQATLWPNSNDHKKSGTPTMADAKEFTNKVLALEKTYPLPLLGVMLDKFPSTMEPAVWWPQQPKRQGKELNGRINRNGWNGELEEEMREIVEVLKRKDKADYLRLGEKALKINKVLAISGPLLTSLAAVGSAFLGSPSHGSWAAVLGCVAGALASVVNTFEHGGQVGMVFEMYRSNASFFSLMEESIESNLKEQEVEGRENGELFEMKVALQLGRSLSELKGLTASSLRKREAIEEFGSKLF